MCKRGLSSPDRADALAYAFARVEITGIDVESHAGESTGNLMRKAWYAADCVLGVVGTLGEAVLLNGRATSENQSSLTGRRSRPSIQT